MADRFGFVLGGGLALILHGIVSRPTEDVDVFGDEDSSIAAAAKAVTEALRAAGIAVEQVDTGSDVVEGLDDLIAWKVAALANRAEVRDFVDVAAFLADLSPAALVSLAKTVDPGMFDEDVAAAGRRLDETPDRAFSAYGLDAEQVKLLRARFQDWPR